MNKKINDFTEEITDKFSELYVETFLIRYLSEFPEQKLIMTLKNSQDILMQKIKTQIIDKLFDMGYAKNDIDI